MSGVNFNDTDDLPITETFQSLTYKDLTTQISGATPDPFGWHISTFGSSISEDVSSEDTIPFGIYISNDGMRLYISGQQNDSIYEYALTKPNDITNMVFTGNSLVVGPGTLGAFGLSFTPGEELLYVHQAVGTIRKYSLSTPGDLSTAIEVESRAFATGNSTSILILPDETAFLLLIKLTSFAEIQRYDMSNPGVLGSAVLTETFEIPPALSLNNYNIAIKPDGKILYTLNNTDETFEEWYLTDAYHVSPDPILIDTVNSPIVGGDQAGIMLSNSGDVIFLVTSTTSLVHAVNVGLDIQGDLVAFASNANWNSDTDTETLGLNSLYSCTDTSSARTLTISKINYLKGTVINPWFFEVFDESGAATVSESISIEGEPQSVTVVGAGATSGANFTIPAEHDYVVGSRVFHGDDFTDLNYRGAFDVITVVSTTIYEVQTTFGVTESGTSRLSIQGIEKSEIIQTKGRLEFHSTGINLYSR